MLVRGWLRVIEWSGTESGTAGAREWGLPTPTVLERNIVYDVPRPPALHAIYTYKDLPYTLAIQQLHMQVLKRAI